MSADRVDITTSNGTRIQISSGQEEVKTSIQPSSEAPVNTPRTSNPQLEKLKKQMSAKQAPRFLDGHEETKAGVRASDLDKQFEELRYEDLLGKFTQAELTTVKKSAEQLRQTRINHEDPNSEAFHDALEVLATAIKSSLIDDDQGLKVDFINSSLYKNLGNLYNQEFLNNLMAIKSNPLENSELKEAAVNMMTYLKRAASHQIQPQTTEKPPF